MSNPSAHKGLGVCWVTAGCWVVARVNFNERKLPNCSLNVSDMLQTTPDPDHSHFPQGHALALGEKPVKPSEGCFKLWSSN